MSMYSRVNPHKLRVKMYCGNQENIWYDENNYDKDLELEQKNKEDLNFRPNDKKDLIDYNNFISKMKINTENISSKQVLRKRRKFY